MRNPRFSGKGRETELSFKSHLKEVAHFKKKKKDIFLKSSKFPSISFLKMCIFCYSNE